MKIHSVFDPEFARYGRVMSGYDLEPLLATLEAVSPMPETGTAYVAEQPELMALPVAKALSDRAFGGLPVELGWCNGRNTKLNCLEYHRSSELNLGTEDFILLLGRREDMTDGENPESVQDPAEILPEEEEEEISVLPAAADSYTSGPYSHKM